MGDILDIPKWDLSMIGIIDHSGHCHVNAWAVYIEWTIHSEAMDDIDCGKAVTATNPIY